MLDTVSFKVFGEWRFRACCRFCVFFVLSWDPTPRLCRLRHLPLQKNRQKTAEAQIIRALIIGIGFWGPFYYNCNKEPPKSYRQLFIEAPIIRDPQNLDSSVPAYNTSFRLAA